ncbi:MAG: dTDP-glucose 4,6-dehydratase [Patescibacteria group bacterium]|nr:dTDP-glucose 4,6-dehydratase [Patescibacteria group bacterium]
MKILITGGAGFIGSNFVRYWIKHYPKDEIVVLDKLTYAGNLENLADVKDRISFVKGDICDEAAADKAMAKADMVVHFAAESHNDRAIMDPDVFVRTNVFGTHVLLKAALRRKVKRFHHISTDEVFGDLPLNSKIKWNEASPYNPRSPYAASKAGSDHLVRAFYHTYGLPVTITNCTNNFGPFMFPEKFLPLAITNLLEGKKIPIYGNGRQVRDWLYVDDHCSAIDLVLHKGKIGDTYLVGSEHREYANLEVAKILAKIMGEGEDCIEFVKDRPGHDQKYSINAQKIQTELGWKPKHEFKEWLEITVDWYKNNKSWWQRVKSGEYQKYYTLQYKNR